MFMKGFPNQVAELPTLTKAMVVMANLLAQGKNPKDDGVFGEALIRTGVLGTGHKPIPVEEYLATQKKKPKVSDQSYRTRARGLRELFRVLGLIHDSSDRISATIAGHQIAGLDDPTSPAGLQLWRNVILQMTHDGGDGESSHPYQVLLRLVAKRPGITRAKSALALEAKNDSDEELDRITALSDLGEDKILEAIHVTESNWDNAKKILPRFAEQLGDVFKGEGQQFFLADAPGSGDDTLSETEPHTRAPSTRRPKSASAVNANTIAKSGTSEGWDEADEIDESQLDPEALRACREKLRDRLHRHNLIVQRLAALVEQEGGKLFENPFDCLAGFDSHGLLAEVKSLDGTPSDEVSRVRDALAQLLYYEAFVTEPLIDDRMVKKVACFEKKISEPHVQWLQKNNISVIWCDGDRFDGTAYAKDQLSGHFGF